ncbi:MAG TPA: glycosyltransferase family 2 protein [Aliidongia sp.]|uniref:glycosyltransferase family 2 protein n=1 Tax=Aliidongia sp. TaxID=1914230 RepID=UPI002DDCEBC3|nr:glycosyltransferase family 2 protein [Aliidongia sp.]HEV2676087.1 glycosyltransferase family 2 protein [Aliidongia sp.]
MVIQSAGMIDVIIVNWNSGRHLADCLAALARNNGKGLIKSTIVVDNASSDDSLAVETSPDLPLVVDRVDENLGFGRGCNRGAALGDADFLLFLNPDARVRPGALEAGLSALQNRRATGIVGLKLVDHAGETQESCSTFPTASAVLARALALDRLPWLSRFRAFLPKAACIESRAVDQVMGACWFMPRPLFQALGGFDERFFMYYEDADLALRAMQAGRGSWFEISGEVEHIGGGSSGAIPAKRLFYFLQSRFIFAKKHFGYGQYIVVLFATLAIEPWSRLVLAGWRQGSSGFRSVIAGYRLLWCYLVSEN